MSKRGNEGRDLNDAIAREVMGWTTGLMSEGWIGSSGCSSAHDGRFCDLPWDAYGYFDPAQNVKHLEMVEERLVELGWRYSFTLDKLGLEGEGNRALAVFTRHRWIADSNEDAAGHGTGRYAKNDAVCAAALAAVRLTG